MFVYTYTVNSCEPGSAVTYIAFVFCYVCFCTCSAGVKFVFTNTYILQGDQLADVFQFYPDIHVNFTVFSMMHYNTSVKYSERTDDGFNTSLAHDALTVLNEALTKPFIDTDILHIRNSITSRITQVNLRFLDHSRVSKLSPAARCYNAA